MKISSIAAIQTGRGVRPDVREAKDGLDYRWHVEVRLARFDERYLQSGVRLGKSSSDDGASCATSDHDDVYFRDSAHSNHRRG